MSITAVHHLTIAPPPPHAPAATEWESAIDRIITGQAPVTTVFQPIVDLYRGCTAGYESLSRFSGPFNAGPDEWLAQASGLGRGIELERQCLVSAMAALPKLPPNTFLTVNVSPELLGSSEWHVIIGLYPRLERLVVEVTEHAAIADYAAARRALQQARSRGALIAVDDAGSGYASMQHVVTLRPDFVKIDRLFVGNCGHDPAKAAVLEALGRLAATLDAWIVAEGVEREDELECLLRLGVPLAQGYLLARPAAEWREPEAEARAMVAAHRRRTEDVGRLSALLEQGATTFGTARGAIPLVLTLVLDEHKRPQRWDGRGVPLSDNKLLVVKGTTPVKAAARRAMARPEAERFLPIVCTDDEGKYVGMVKVDRLVEFLAGGA